MNPSDRPELRDFIELHSVLLDTRLTQQELKFREHLNNRIEHLTFDISRRMVDERLELLR